MTALFIPTICDELGEVALYESEGKIVIEAPLPGLKAEDIQITFNKGWVFIEGKTAENKKGPHYSFKYQTPIPRDLIDEETTPEASCKDGLLFIAFAKKKSQEPLKIVVKNN